MLVTDGNIDKDAKFANVEKLLWTNTLICACPLIGDA
jgi:hypothetical protein